MNLKKFKAEKEKVTSEDGDSILYHIICLDIYNQKKYLIMYNNFDLEEAKYFFYVVNDFIKKKKNMLTIS